jgi:uncharacterized membrane protein
MMEGDMKKHILLAACIIAAVPSMAQVQYAVSGTYTVDGKKVFLIDELTEKAVDSTVVANGQFYFTGSAEKDALMGVKAGDSRWTTEFFNDGKALHSRLQKIFEK